MKRTVGGTMGLAALVLLAGCGGGAAPGTVSPQQADSLRQAAAAEARRDSLVAAARADSVARAVAEQARADSVARAVAEQTRADSIRAEVARSAAMNAALGPSGLPLADDSVLVDRIHFAFDRSDLQPEYRALLEQKAPLFQRYPALQVEIAGHCDERGSDEYNLALGLRRAAAAKQYLVALGVAPARISIVSFGKERPADPGHDETAWATNRRDEFTAKR
jgi:peptidoglycan-associated lipoprotein